MSPVDSSSKEFQETMKDFNNRIFDYFAEPSITEPCNSTVNGTMLERWLVKTLVNTMLWNPTQYKDWKPNPILAKLTFGRIPFDYLKGQGLYLFAPARPNNNSRIWGALRFSHW